MRKGELFKGEKILTKTRPHPLAFSNIYVIWAYIIAVGLVFILLIAKLEETTFSIPLFIDSSLSIKTSPWIYYFFLVLLILIPGIKFRPLSIYGGYALALYVLSRLFKEPLQHSLTPIPALSEQPVLSKIALSDIPVLLESFLSRIPILSEISVSKIPLLSDISKTPPFSEAPIFSDTAPLSSIVISFVPDQKFFLTAWLLMILIPGIIIALTQINWKWFALFIAMVVFITGLKIEFGLDLNQINLLLISFGILGAFGTEIWRRRHRYYITDLRIVTECLGKRREVFYDRIVDLILEGSLLGRIFNFGSVTPLTGSGIGTGMDISLIGTSMSKSLKGKMLGVMFGGGKTISTPRARSPYILYGIPNPKREYKRITGFMLGLYEEGNVKEKNLQKTASTYSLNSSNETHDCIFGKVKCSFRRKLLKRFLHRNTANNVNSAEV